MADSIGGNAAKLLTDLVARIERQEDEKAEIAEGIKTTYLEAKVAGFDVKVLRKVIALRKLDPNDREEMLSAQALYMRALGMDGSDLV